MSKPVPVPVPVRIAIVNDYDIVVQGLARMFEPFSDRVTVVEVSSNQPGVQPVDIALVDTFAQHRDVNEVLSEANAERLVIYSWSLEPQLIQTWSRFGVVGFLDKRLVAADLVDALEKIHAGEEVNGVVRPELDIYPGDWPGRPQGLSARESEVIALITLGLSNQEAADRAYLSINTVKSYIRSSYAKMGVTSRSRAVLWGLDHGFRPDHVKARAPDLL
ncbi:MAG: response regulator transcription factor [Marmoricola sp.]